MGTSYMIGIDQSTQGTKVLLFDDLGHIVYKHSRGHAQLVNEQGWVSHDLDEIYTNVIQLINDMVTNIDVPLNDIVGLGISVQRETAAAWAKSDGHSLAKAIVWQDARAQAITDAIAANGQARWIQDRTGLKLSPYFTAAKFSWLLARDKNVQAARAAGDLCLGTMDSWLLYRLTHGQAFKTEPSNASRTQLFNLERRQWDAELCTEFGVPMAALPEVVASNALFGETDFDGILPHALPIHCMLGDSQAALFGQGCASIGDVKATIGTGSSVMMNIGPRPLRSDAVVTSIGWTINGKTTYVAEGNINYAGAVIRWLVNDVQLLDSASQAEAIARQATGSDRTYLVPAFTGLGAPYWRPKLTATLTGMTRTTGRAEITRAALNSIAFQIRDILVAINEMGVTSSPRLKVDGGVTANAYLMQFQSDIANVDVWVPDVEELSALGVAYCAGRALMVYGQQTLSHALTYQHYQPTFTETERADWLSGWQQAIAGGVSRN